ncbi:MAG: glycosyltransferase family 8 protein, partial [Lachnospiraceae bacterium]|nr:glycosyltransferase family 8 protein [Lachnospiraceae bacterium]
MGIPVLVTVDENYIHCLKVMLYSLKLNNLKQSFDIYLLHRNINKKAIDNLKTYNEKIGNNLIPICINGDIFINAPSSERYPQEMYYRLLAH